MEERQILFYIIVPNFKFLGLVVPKKSLKEKIQKIAEKHENK